MGRWRFSPPPPICRTSSGQRLARWLCPLIVAVAAQRSWGLAMTKYRRRQTGLGGDGDARRRCRSRSAIFIISRSSASGKAREAALGQQLADVEADNAGCRPRPPRFASGRGRLNQRGTPAAQAAAGPDARRPRAKPAGPRVRADLLAPVPRQECCRICGGSRDVRGHRSVGHHRDRSERLSGLRWPGAGDAAGYRRRDPF